MHHNELYSTDFASHHQCAIDQTIYSIKHNIPIARITNYRHFYNSYFYISPFVFDPRLDTANLVDLTIQYNPKTILDIGTGSGSILISALKELPHSTGVGYDISPYALDCAQYNASRLLQAYQYTFINELRMLQNKFDVIISNPPYIKSIPDQSTRFDPPLSLYYQKNIYQHLKDIACQFLHKNGHLLLEIPTYLCNPFLGKSKCFIIEHLRQSGDVVFLSLAFDHKCS